MFSQRSHTAVIVFSAACIVFAGFAVIGTSKHENLQLAATRASTGCRNVRAQAQMDRRTAMTGLFGAMAVGANKAFAVTSPDLIDDRKAKSTGFDIIYEARDLSLDQDTRDGFTQARSGLKETKTRVMDAEKKLTEAGAFVDKKYWTEGRNVLRRLVGTLRFDLAALADTKSGADKKAAIKANKEFFTNLESLDLAMYKKNPAAGKKAYEKTVAAYKAATALY
uniref:Photosystem II oxygen evolving enhancer protein 3 n=1 Tax=Gymnochlora stellata TaxID=67809 RepID=B5A4I8_GYMST|nr:photosystem II oxygen evolving enhancer protein 3 [Gymnochlora stellata]